MDNRFFGMNDYLSQVVRARGPIPVVPRAVPIYARPHSAVFAAPFAASDRALVVLIENRGIDLGLPALVDKLCESIPGASIIPADARRTIVEGFNEKIRTVSDNLLETAELSINRYAGSRPEYFGDVIILRDSTSTYDDLKRTLIAQTNAGKIIDVIVLTHGTGDYIAVTGGVTGAKIVAIKNELGRPLSIRAVYMMNCVGASLNQSWLDAGARVASGSMGNNYLPEPTTFFFWSAWKEGQSFGEAATSAYRKTVNLMNDAARGLVSALPIPGSSLIADQIDFAQMDFVRDSAPVVQGQQSLTISSDNLTTAQSLSSGLATTVLPLSLLRSLSDPAPPPALPRVRPLSLQGLEFVKQWEGFRERPGDDGDGQCAVGYGSVLHAGACDGRPVEQPYLTGISRDAAAELLTQECSAVRQVIEDSITTALNQNQSDALISFVHNVGGDAFRASTLRTTINAGDLIGAAREIRKWTKAAHNGGLIEMPVLVKRREAEAALFEQAEAIALSMSGRRRGAFARSFGAVDYAVPGVLPIIVQPTPRTCWAAVMTMMITWRRGQSMAVRDAVAQLGQTYLALFDNDRILPPATAPALYADAGLSTIQSFNPTIDGWEALLRKYGPLYVDVGYDSGNITHAIIVTGIRGDGTPGGTSITYIDPVDGSNPTQVFSDFLRLYEAPSAVKWPYVIVHWPVGASAQQSLSRSSSYSFHSPSLVTAQTRYSLAQNPAAAVIAGIEVADAIQIGLAGVALVQAQAMGSQGSFSLAYDKAQRLLLPEARQQMPGAQSSKQSYSQLLFHLGIGRLGTAKADVIAEWEGNPYGEIGTVVIRRDLGNSTEWSKSAANITITRVERIPLPHTDPRAWPIVYTYEGTFDPLGNGYFEFSGEFEVNAFGGLKFNRHEVFSRSMADWALAGTPENKVQRGADVTVAVPEIPQEQIAYLRTRLP